MSKVAQKHVVPSMSGGWAVRNSGSIRASRLFDTQSEAVEFGRLAAKKEATELFIHRRDGTVQSRSSYGNDPFPPRDKK
jgi:hypothetical protein